uniref:PB1-like domain-containing protein n=1 Tax=Tanacetum cinerariifolium TaxID=118510 RepID=A0A6L2JJ06_TANCI|nr:hypothetical protein [Tanacetum cinerariifolium]
MFSIRIHHGGKYLSYPGRIYVSGRVDIFDMVDIDLFTAVALNMMVLILGHTSESEPTFYNYLRPLTSLDVGLYGLACEEDVRCLATLVRSFKLIEVYIEHGVTVLEFYLKEPRFRETLEDITDEPVGSIAANITKKMLLLTWQESSKTIKKHACNSITPSSFPQHDSSTPCKDYVCESIIPMCMPDCILTPPTDESVITYTQLSGAHGVDTQSHVLLIIQSQFSNINLSFVSQQATTSQVIDDVMRQLSFDERELDGEAGFADVARNGVDSSGLSHDESFGVDDLNLKLNKPVITQEPIVAEVSTQEPIVAEVNTEAPIVEEFFYDDEGIDTTYETEYDVQSSEDTGIDEDDDVDEDFLVDKYNEIVELDIDVYLFGISMDLPFDNTNLVRDDVLEREDVDFINADGFDSDLGNDEERNYKKRRLAELWTKMEGLINASGRAKSNLLLNNICEVFNGKIVGGRDKPVIKLLECIKKYCMKRIVNVQGVIDKCIGPLTPTATKIMESIKKETYLIKVQCNRANKYQVSGSLGDQCVMDVESTKTKLVVGQDGLGGSGAGAVIGLSTATGEGGAVDPGGAGVASQGSSHTRWTRRRVQTKKISPQKRTSNQPASQPSTSSQVPVSQIRNGDGREIGDDVPT